jgi:hypothetical protein
MPAGKCGCGERRTENEDFEKDSAGSAAFAGGSDSASSCP